MDPAPKNRYHLLACDLDGTLMGDDTIIPPGVRQALAKVQDRGIHVTLATGRGFPETLPFARQLKIKIPLICYQGGLIKHPLTQEVLFRATMNRQLVLKVVRLAQERQWHLIVYLGDTMYIQDFRHGQRFYNDLLSRDIQQVDDLTAVVAHGRVDPAKFLIVADEGAPQAADRIEEDLQQRFGTELHVVRSHLLFIEGNPLGVSKGEGLRRLAEYLALSQARVMAIGDQGNDVAMLEWAGLGVAMGNGSDAAKAAADWIAPSLDNDGVIATIERFLLK
jgi:Cof subfamily protein (haloacid dehalogenase superfamily)